MTPEEGYELAKKQRPGVVIIMGPDVALEWRMKPLGWLETRALRETKGPYGFIEAIRRIKNDL